MRFLMINLLLICLFLFGIGYLAFGYDETVVFDCPDVPHAKFQFHFTREFIALTDTAVPFDAVSDIYFHTYDVEAGMFDKFTQYYGEALKAANWQNLQEDNAVLLYILTNP